MSPQRRAARLLHSALPYSASTNAYVHALGKICVAFPCKCGCRKWRQRVVASFQPNNRSWERQNATKASCHRHWRRNRRHRCCRSSGKLRVEVAVYERASDLGEVGAGIEIGRMGCRFGARLGSTQGSRGWRSSRPRSCRSIGRRRASASPAAHGDCSEAIWRALHHGASRRRTPAAACQGAGQRDHPECPLHRRVLLGPRRGRDLCRRQQGRGRSDRRRRRHRSVVRECLFGAVPARFTEQIGWRAILPISSCRRGWGPDKSVRHRAH